MTEEVDIKGVPTGKCGLLRKVIGAIANTDWSNKHRFGDWTGEITNEEFERLEKIIDIVPFGAGVELFHAESAKYHRGHIDCTIPYDDAVKPFIDMVKKYIKEC